MRQSDQNAVAVKERGLQRLQQFHARLALYYRIKTLTLSYADTTTSAASAGNATVNTAAGGEVDQEAMREAQYQMMRHQRLAGIEDLSLVKVL